jgi:hypothetical protein
MDGNGHESETGIEIVYPLFVAARYDDYTADQIGEITYNVLGNDEIASGITPVIQFIDFSNGESYVSSLTDWSGSWSVDGNNQVVFTPKSDFGGGDVHVEYVITDNDGHYSRSGFTIHFPVGPTPVCTVTQLTTLEEVYNAITNDLSLTSENGERRFEAELDNDAYIIDPDLYVNSTAVNGLNPMYMIRYDERTWTTQSNESFTEVDMSLTEVGLYDSNDTWYYIDSRSGNDRGYKYLASEGAGGSYTVEDDGSNTLSIEDEGEIFSFKIVQTIGTSDINTILENAGINLTLEDTDTAQMHLSKELVTYYDWWGPFDDQSYADFDAFVQAFSYDSNANEAYGQELVHNNATWQKGILFAENSAGNTSGILVEVDRQSNNILVDDAGSWEIRSITDSESGETYQILDIRPTLCGYKKKIYKLEGTTIVQGQIDDEAGVVNAELAFSESLKNKLQAFFIDEAPLNIDPDDPVNPEITDAMLDGKIFYTEEEDPDTGVTDYKRLTVDTGAQQIRKEDFTLDSNGDVIESSDENLSYEIDEGRIRIQSDDDVKIGLNEIDANGDWNVTIYTWDGIDNELWMITKPAGFPN